MDEHKEGQTSVRGWGGWRASMLCRDGEKERDQNGSSVNQKPNYHSQSAAESHKELPSCAGSLV